MSFVESYADLATYHVVPIRAYYDGICSVEKGLEARERWPERFVYYVGVDPMEGAKAIEDLERQIELFGAPVGLKLYPNSWLGDEVAGWLMDDPEVAFPLFERAQQLGIRTVAVHKAIPLGPVELVHYRVDDVDRAAIAFPDLNFEIVHGGMAFLEETAWQIARFRNVWVNLETTATLLTNRPGRLRARVRRAGHGGPRALSQIVLGHRLHGVPPAPAPGALRAGLPVLRGADRPVRSSADDRRGQAHDPGRELRAHARPRPRRAAVGDPRRRVRPPPPDGAEPAPAYSTTAVGDVAY